MTKKQKLVNGSPHHTEVNSGDKIITELILKRKLQQEALKKIMTSIDQKEEVPVEQLTSPEKKRIQIKKLLTSVKNSRKKTR